MDVRTFCLGVLALGDASGYEIKKSLEGPFNHFFDASYGSIYPALTKLAEDGLVTVTTQSQDGRPDKKIYSISQEGRLTLVDALTREIEKDKMRSDFLVRMMFAALLSPRQIADLIGGRLAYHEQVLAKMGKLENWAASFDDQNGAMSLAFVLGYGTAIHAAAHKYIEENRHMIEGSAFVASIRAAKGA